MFFDSFISFNSSFFNFKVCYSVWQYISFLFLPYHHSAISSLTSIERYPGSNLDQRNTDANCKTQKGHLYNKALFHPSWNVNIPLLNLKWGPSDRPTEWLLREAKRARLSWSQAGRQWVGTKLNTHLLLHIKKVTLTQGNLGHIFMSSPTFRERH